MITVRDAIDIKDAEDIAHHGALMIAESQFKLFEYDFLKTKFFIDEWIKNPAGIVIVAEDDKEFVGFMMGVVSEQWWGRHITVGEMALYVIPEKRGSAAAPKLLAKFIEVSKGHGAEEIAAGISTGFDKGATRLYEKMGFVNCGNNFRMNMRKD